MEIKVTLPKTELQVSDYYSIKEERDLYKRALELAEQDLGVYEYARTVEGWQTGRYLEYVKQEKK